MIYLATQRRLITDDLLILRGDVDHRRALPLDPLRLGHRPVGDDVATGGAVLVMDRLQLRVHVGRAVHRAPLRVLAS